MIKETKEIIMKHPLMSILTTVALVVPYYLAIAYYDWHNLKSIGWPTHIGSAIIFSFVPWALWVGISRASIEMTFYKQKKSDTTVEFNQSLVSWEKIISIGSFVMSIWCFLSLTVVCLFHFPFKYFLILTFILPITRSMITLIQYYILKKNK